MLVPALLKHAREFRRHLANKAFEVLDDGAIRFPLARAVAHGEYFHDVNGSDLQTDSNLIPDQGLIYLLNVGLNNATKLPAWYLSLYSANYTPTTALTAASYPATASEITSTTEGYAGANRPTWTPTTPTTPLIDNVASRAAYTIATASSLTVWGAALLSEPVRGAVTGTIVSAGKFSAARVLYNSDAFNLGWRVQLSSS